MFTSARAGYVVVGSDIGGYLDFDDKNLGDTVPAFADDLRALDGDRRAVAVHGAAWAGEHHAVDHPRAARRDVSLYRYWASFTTSWCRSSTASPRRPTLAGRRS